MHTDHQAYPIRTQPPRGPSLETWLIRAGHSPAVAGVIAEIAGFRRHDDAHQLGALYSVQVAPKSLKSEGRRHA